MNKTELIAAMAEASGLSKKDCEAALAAFITTYRERFESWQQSAAGGLRLFRGQRTCCPYWQESCNR